MDEFHISIKFIIIELNFYSSSIPNLSWHLQKLLLMEIMLPFWESLAMRFVYCEAAFYDNLRLMAWNKIDADICFYPFLFCSIFITGLATGWFIYRCKICFGEYTLSCVPHSIFLFTSIHLSTLSVCTFNIWLSYLLKYVIWKWLHLFKVGSTCTH